MHGPELGVIPERAELKGTPGGGKTGALEQKFSEQLDRAFRFTQMGEQRGQVRLSAPGVVEERLSPSDNRSCLLSRPAGVDRTLGY